MTARIVAPVSRTLAAADVRRSAAFYRDLLGFDVHETPEGTEVTCGPARLRIEAGEPEPAILFFQTDDVAAMEAGIRARGGHPSDVTRVNWIKMEMFEVRDPDGHVLFFGQSYDRPHAATPAPMFRKALPRLPLSDLAAGIVHYRDVLGFQVNHADDKIGVMFRDKVTVLLFCRTERNSGVGEAYFYIEDADRLCAELRAQGANVQGDPISYPWGLREFSVRDLEGNELYFGQTFE